MESRVVGTNKQVRDEQVFQALKLIKLQQIKLASLSGSNNLKADLLKQCEVHIQ